MSLIGVCVAWGNDDYIKRAQNVLRIWSYHHNDAKAFLVKADPNNTPDFIRSKVLDYVDFGDVVSYMDVDTICLKRTTELTGDFGLVEDFGEAIKMDEAPELWNNRIYYNAGYFMVRKTLETQELFKKWWDKRYNTGDAYKDQSALNRLLIETGFKVTTLPLSNNYITRAHLERIPNSTSILHWAGWGHGKYFQYQDAYINKFIKEIETIEYFDKLVKQLDAKENK